MGFSGRPIAIRAAAPVSAAIVWASCGESGAGFSEPESVEPYRPDWYAHDRRERLFQAAERHLVARPCAQPEPGDVVLFRFRAERPATHCGIAGVSGSLIHAYERSAVIVSVLPDAWRRRIAGIFAFPAYPKS